MFKLFTRKPRPVYFTRSEAQDIVAAKLGLPLNFVEVLELREGEMGTYGAKVRVFAERRDRRPSRRDYEVAEVIFG